MTFFTVTDENLVHDGIQLYPGPNMIETGTVKISTNNIISLYTYGRVLWKIEIDIKNQKKEVDTKNQPKEVEISNQPKDSDMSWVLYFGATDFVLVECYSLYDISIYLKFDIKFTLIDWAILRNDLNLVKEIILKGFMVNGTKGRTIYSAISHGNLDIFKLLVENGLDVHIDSDGAIIDCAERDRFEILKYLVDIGCDIHTNNEEALLVSAKGGHLNIVKLLVENGADVTKYNSIALRLASHYGHLDIVKYLAENGCDIHNCDLVYYPKNLNLGCFVMTSTIDSILPRYVPGLYPPLVESCYRGHLDIVRYLVENGVDINQPKDSPIKLSMIYNQLDIIKYLVKNGANIEQYETLEHCIRKRSTSLLKYIIKEIGIDIHYHNDLYLTAASEHGYLEIVQLILENGGKSTQTTDALLIAATRGHLDVVRYLLENGVNDNDIYQKLLRISRENDHTDIIAYLEPFIRV